MSSETSLPPARARITRRQFLRWSGTAVGSVLVAGSAGVTVRAIDQGVFAAGDGAAYAAWQHWRDGSAPLSLVRAAVLAASGHNTQPWLFRVTNNTIDLFADGSKATGALDPLRREMHISLGCALENLAISGRTAGLSPEIALLPSDDATHVASVKLTPREVQASPLYEAIPSRRTNRYAYAKREVTDAVLRTLTDANTSSGIELVWFTSESDRQRFGDLTIAATQAFIADREQAEASHRWFRSDWDDVQRYKDGLTLDAVGLSWPLTVVAKILPSASLTQANSTYLKSTRETQVPTAAAFGVIAVSNRYDRGQQLEGGRLWQRLHLTGTTLGLAMQPLNQAIERADREKELASTPLFTDALAGMMPSQHHALMAFRIGYPKHGANKSPRRPAEEVVIH